MKFDFCRHFRVKYRFPYFCTSSEFLEYLQEFDQADIYENDTVYQQSWDICFCSPLKRAQETARLIGNVEEIIADDRLKEVSLNPVINSKIKLPTFVWFLSSKFTWRMNWSYIGETREQTHERIRSFLEELEQDYSGKRILIISHKLTMIVIREEMKTRKKILGFWNVKHGKVYS